MKFKDAENFWANALNPYIRPVDYAVKNIPALEAFGFVKGCMRVNDLVRMIDPDIVFVAERGAGPIFWAADRIAELRSDEAWKNLPRIYLPIGSGNDDRDFDAWGPRRDVKTEIIKKAVQKVYRDFSEDGEVPFKRALIIDEVQNGGTITCLTKDLKNVALGMDPRINDKPIATELHVIAMEDTRFKLPDGQKARGYKAIVGNSRADIYGLVVRLPLFTVDRQIFLDHLLGSREASETHNIPTMVVPNLRAQRL